MHWDNLSLEMIHMWCPWKLYNFQDPLLSLSCPQFFHPHNLGRPISKETPPPPVPSPNDNQSIKRKHNTIKSIGWLLYVIKSFFQVNFRFQYQLISLVLLSFDFFLFNWSLTICFSVTLYSCVCFCQKISRNDCYL